MELYTEILAKALEKGKVEVRFPEMDLARLVESESYKLPQAIRSIINDADRSDADCFHAIEEMVCLFEEAGIDCGSRHDF